VEGAKCGWTEGDEAALAVALAGFGEPKRRTLRAALARMQPARG
jgi:hypothetical protein